MSFEITKQSTYLRRSVTHELNRIRNHRNARFVLELSMPIAVAELATFLTTIHLFHYLSEEQIGIVAGGLKEVHLGADVETTRWTIASTRWTPRATPAIR